MLAMRMMKHGGASDEHDSRSVEAVLDAAAKRLGEPSTPAASRQLEVNGVKWAWQMTHLSDADWSQLGVSLGLKTAAKAELENPTVIAPPAAAYDSAPTRVAHEESTDRMRRFLLLPDAEGREAKPLGEMSALFLGLLTVPVAERQSLLLALCELMALVSGLFLSTPFEFRRNFTTGTSEAAAANIWSRPPTLADGMDALVALIFITNFFVADFSVCMALYVAAGGNQTDDRFCEKVMDVLGMLFAVFILGVFFPLLVICFWVFFTDATSPYPMLACLFMVLVLNNTVGAVTQKFFAEAIALEFYHMPKWFLGMCRQASTFMGTSQLIGETQLRAAAERRAQKLRAQMSNAGGSSSAGTAGVAASAAKRHVHVVH